MVVLKPMFEGEQMKVCTRCGHIGLGSPIKSRRSFYRVGNHRYRSRCCRCSVGESNQWAKDHWAHVLRQRKAKRANMSSEEREKQRAWYSAYYQRRRLDPAFLARRKAAADRYRERNKDKISELRRMDALLARERRGEWKVPPPDSVRPVPTSKTAMPIEPPRKWLNELVATKKHGFLVEGYEDSKAESLAISAVVADLKTSTRRLYAWRYEAREIDFLTIDRLATTHGGITVDEIYRDYGDGYSILIGSDLSCLRIEYWEPNK